MSDQREHHPGQRLALLWRSAPASTRVTLSIPRASPASSAPTVGQDDVDEFDDRPVRLLMEKFTCSASRRPSRKSCFASSAIPRNSIPFPKGLTGFNSSNPSSAFSAIRRREPGTGWKAIDQVGLNEAADRKIAAYSKGMRQRIKLAQAIAHDPKVLVLDEPLNGLDPLVRAETIALFGDWANKAACHCFHHVCMEWI